MGAFERFEIDADIAKAETLPGWVYSDAGVWEACRERVFGRSWQFAGVTDDVRVPGQTRPFTLLEGCLDEPLLLVRGRDDVVRCMSNVCTHRGTILCEHGGVEKGLVCRYHGRRFDLAGRCTHMPEFEGVEGFPAERDHLAGVELGAWGKFLFVRLGGGAGGDDRDGGERAPLAEVVGPMAERLAWYPLGELRFDAGRSRDYLVRANWALYCDNYLEGFHIPFVHPGLGEAIDYGAYTTELYEWSCLQLGVAKGGEGCFDLPASSPDHGREIAAYYWWLFPNTMVNVYPWGISINVVKPLGVDRTRVSFLSYVLDEGRIGEGAGAELDRVEREDEQIVEAVQKGTGARLYGRGRYSPTREQGVHRFHRLLCRELFAG